MSVVTFLQCFKTFTAGLIYHWSNSSDNSIQSFIPYVRCLKVQKLPETLPMQLQIKWKFNLEWKVMWYRGLFEHLIKSTKWCIKKLLENLLWHMRNYWLHVITEVGAIFYSRAICIDRRSRWSAPRPVDRILGTKLAEPICLWMIQTD